MGIERRLLVVAQPDGTRKMLDRLTKDALLQANVADVDACEGVLRLAHQDLLEHEQRVVVLLLQHQRPPQQRLRLRIVRRKLEGLA